MYIRRTACEYANILLGITIIMNNCLGGTVEHNSVGILVHN